MSVSSSAAHGLASAAAATLVLAGVVLALARRRRPEGASSSAAPSQHCTEPLVVVVGLGGVGSHAAHLLLRGGVRRLRLVDFDQVSLSSLNRHATAVRLEVGTPKAKALRDQLLRIAPEAQVEACVSLFNAAAAPKLLGDSPALVIDCIDDLTTKAELLGYCNKRELRVLCAAAPALAARSRRTPRPALHVRSRPAPRARAGARSAPAGRRTLASCTWAGFPR